MKPEHDPSSPPHWLSETAEGTVIRLYVQPGASRTEVAGEHGDGPSARLKIRVASRPVDGAANEALIRLLSERTGTARRDIRIIRGITSRSKDVLFEKLRPEDVLRSLLTK